MAISHCYYTSSCQGMAISHCYSNLVVKNGNFTLLLTSSGQEWQFQFCYWHLVVKHGNFSLLLKTSEQEFCRWTFFSQWTPHTGCQRCLEYQYTKLGRLNLLWLTGTPSTSGQDMPCIPVHTTWQINLTFAQWTSQGSMAEMPLHCYWHFVVRNGNFTLLLTSSGHEWQYYIATDI